MTREIKFRGKRKDTGDWVYGCLYYFNYHSNPKNPVRDFIAPINQVAYVNGEAVEEWEVIPESVGQYTGLKDKNGVEVYEGDILQLGDKKKRTVFSVPGGFAIESLDMDFGKFGKQTCTPIEGITDEQNANFISYTTKVIGNIHDNPSLLEVQP